MRDKRYRKTEDAILKVFFKESKNEITMVKMAKKAGIGRSTMYVHHHAIKKIIPDYEKYILREYGLTMRRRSRAKNTTLKSLYFDTLVFILRNRKIFEMFLRFDDRDIIIKMIEKLKVEIAGFARLPKNSEKIFKIYTGEIVEVIFEWGKKGLPENELEKVLSDIIYLTNTCRDRLMPINW